MSEEKFDPEHFDVELELEKIRSEVKKPNIFICGATGSGKSSLISDIFNYSLDKAPKIGSVSPTTRGVHKYESDELGVILHDSEGYEIGSEKQRYYKEEIIGYVDDCNSSHKLGDMDTRIHETWYCVSAGNKKFFDVDASIINDLKRRKIPVCVVITKVDCVDKSELEQLISAVKSEIPGIDVFTYASLPGDPALKEKLTALGYIQQDELLHWAAANLDESLRNGLLGSVNGAIGDKHAYVIKTIVPVSTLSAVGIVIGNSFVPVPFPDSLALMGLQSVMALKIMNAYNIAGTGKQIVGTVVGSSLISTLGKSLASTLAKAIPGISQAVAVANSTVAASLTATIGLTINEICCQYMKLCVNGSNLPLNFGAFFTPEIFKETFEMIQNSSGDLIKQIMESALSGINNKLNGGKS